MSDVVSAAVGDVDRNTSVVAVVGLGDLLAAGVFDAFVGSFSKRLNQKNG